MRRGVGLTFVLAAVLAVCASLSASAHPPAPVDGLGHPIRGKVHAWFHQAKVPIVRGRVRVRMLPCPSRPDFVGCVFNADPRTLYISPSAGGPRLILYHELGHVFDLHVLNRRDRRRFKRIIGIHRSGWFEGELPPAEWFADGYAACAVRLRLRRREAPTPYGYSPTSSQHERVCRLIQAAAEPRGRPPKRPRKPPPVVEVKPPPPEESQPGQGEGCTLFDELLTGCTPPPPAPPLPAA